MGAERSGIPHSQEVNPRDAGLSHSLNYRRGLKQSRVEWEKGRGVETIETVGIKANGGHTAVVGVVSS